MCDKDYLASIKVDFIFIASNARARGKGHVVSSTLEINRGLEASKDEPSSIPCGTSDRIISAPVRYAPSSGSAVMSRECSNFPLPEACVQLAHDPSPHNETATLTSRNLSPSLAQNVHCTTRDSFTQLQSMDATVPWSRNSP